MVLKKTSPYIKIGIILISIIIVGVFHYQLSKTYSNKYTHTLDVIKQLQQNKINLQKINTLSELIETGNNKYKKEILSTADIIDYSFSILLNVGKFSDNETKIYYNNQNALEEQKNKTLKKAWNKYHNSLIQLSNNNDEVLSSILKNHYSSFYSKQNSTIFFYTEEYNSYKNIFNLINIIATLLYISISILLFFFIRKNFINPIKSIETIIDDISEGTDIKEHSVHEYYNAIITSLNKLESKTKERYNFANQLINGNLEVNFKSFNKKNLLEASLVQLKQKLKENIKESAKRIEEEKERQWFAEGQAKFNNLLRESSESVNLLASNSVKNIVKFFDAAQGGFFILKDDGEKALELIASFAYDRIKSLNKIIPVGEGLIGMCAHEGNTIWVNNVPDDYMDIESGLGEAPPTNILIVPLKNNNNILGVIEIASFTEFKKNEVIFIETIAENIASTLETTKITDKTAKLLEDSQKQSQELAIRDAEMSEKIAELRELQKQTSKSKTEMTSLILAVDKVLFKLEISLSGKISFANKILTNKLKYDIKGKKISEIVSNTDIEELVKKVEKDTSVQCNLNIRTKDNKTIKTQAFFSPIKNERGRISKILILANDISNVYNLEKDNLLLTTEVETQKTHLLNINEEKEQYINKYKSETEVKVNELNKLLKKEKIVLKKHETKIDKKYYKWLASFNS